MIESLECLPCLSRQATLTARLSTDSAAKQQAGLGEALMHLAMMEPATFPTIVAEDIQRTVSRHTGSADPYTDVRQRLTAAALALLPALSRMKEEADDSWAVAIRIATAGNLLEEARDPAQAGPAMEAAWQATTKGQLALDHGKAFRDAVSHANHIVFLADNAGEVIWDRLLIELFGTSKVTLVVRRRPYLHDAQVEDLDLSSWILAPRVVAFDDPLPGHPMPERAHLLDQLLAKADIVVAKGSDWPERLTGRVHAEKCFHLLAPSCRRTASRFGVQPKSLVVVHAAALPSPLSPA